MSNHHASALSTILFMSAVSFHLLHKRCFYQNFSRSVFGFDIQIVRGIIVSVLQVHDFFKNRYAWRAHLPGY